MAVMGISRLPDIGIRSMDSSQEIEQELYDGVDVWDDDECISVFTTDEIFRTRDELLKWVRKVAFHFGFVIVILRSDTSTGQRGRKTFVLLGCERGGKYRRYKKDLKVTESGTRKCGCPFRLRGFTCTKKSMLMDMTKSSVKLRNILLTMKEHNEKNVSTIKQVYNARYMYKRSVRGDRTEMQQLMMLLERDMYIYWSRFEEGTNVVQDLFWTHPDSVKLLNAFNIVLMMDSTYKTNRYRMPLFEVVGVTSTGLTFSAAFMLLASERHHNFVWALEKLKGLFLRVDSYPKVVVSDRDIALMNAINVVFPEAANLLCRFHIDKNVKAKCKMIVYPKVAWDQVMESWGAIVDCENVESYEHRVEAFNIPLHSVHFIWTRLSFLDISNDDTLAELSIQQKWAVIMNQFNEVDMAGKINIKAKLREIAYPDKTSLCPPTEKVKTKGAQKGRQSKFGKSTKRIPSYFEHVDVILSQHDSSSSLKCSKGFISETPLTKSIPMLQQFPVGIHPYIVDIVDVKVDGHCGYRAVGALLGMGQES
ncbi:protein FAR-RED IMPAIRED RESPONSE 1-like [Phaseolus vulgaris]|uniref:protein FAR-RED IMPAIRED RESPONSE 1-like n=1 Tax=Phaseolus vulgaris TaxID=3885 RepID=UPI0035CC4FEC